MTQGLDEEDASAGNPAPRAATTAGRQATNAALYVVPIVLGNLLPLITLPIFTNLLTPAEYGAWALAMAYGALMTGIANFGLTIGFERNYFECKEDQEIGRLLYSVLAFVIGAALVVALVTVVWREPISRAVTGSALDGWLLVWAYCATAMMSLKTYYLLYFKNNGDAAAYVWYTVDESLLGAGLSIALVSTTALGASALPVGQLMASATVFCALSMRFASRIPVAFDRGLLRKTLRLSLPLTPRIFIGSLGTHIDKYLVGLLGSIGVAGMYVVGQRVAYACFGYMTALENVFAPEVYRRMFHGGEHAGDDIGRYLTPFAYVSVVAALLLGLLSEELLAVLTPDSYGGAAVIAGILAIHYGLMFFGKQPQLVFASQTHITSALSIFSMALSAAANVLLVRRYGAVGAAGGTLLAGVVSGALFFAASQRAYRIGWEYGRLAAVFGLFAGGCLLHVTLLLTGVPYGVRLAVKTAILVAFAALGVSLGIITRERLAAARDLITRRVMSARHAS